MALSRPEGHDLAIIEAILPRTTAFARKDPGEQTGEQVLIANIDVVFVVQSLSGRGLNVRRLERELVLAWESGARPVVILAKADIAEDTDYQRDLATEVTHDVEVIVESAVTGLGLEEVRALVPPGTTAALLGGSGVGKSTLVNRLVGRRGPGDGRGARARRQGSAHDRGARARAPARTAASSSTRPACVASRCGMPRTASRARFPTSTRYPSAVAFATARTRASRDARSSRRWRPARFLLGGLRATARCSQSCSRCRRRQDERVWAAEGSLPEVQGHVVGKRFCKDKPGSKPG